MISECHYGVAKLRGHPGLPHPGRGTCLGCTENILHRQARYSLLCSGHPTGHLGLLTVQYFILLAPPTILKESFVVWKSRVEHSACYPLALPRQRTDCVLSTSAVINQGTVGCSRVSHGGKYNTSHIAVPMNGLYPGGCAMAAVPGSTSPLSSGTSDCLFSAVSFSLSSSPEVRLQQENRGGLSPFHPLPTSRFSVPLSCGPSGLCCLSCHYQDAFPGLSTATSSSLPFRIYPMIPTPLPHLFCT